MAVTVPAIINMAGNIEIGDTIEFIEKFNAFQSELGRFSGEANQMALELNNLVADFNTLVTDSENNFSDQVDQATDNIDLKTSEFNQLSANKESSLTLLSDQKKSEVNQLSDSRVAEINTLAVSHKTDMQGLLQQSQQALSDTNQHHLSVTDMLNQARDISDQIATMLEQVVAAQQQALILATDQLPDTTIARLEAEIRRTKTHRILNNGL